MFPPSVDLTGSGSFVLNLCLCHFHFLATLPLPFCLLIRAEDVFTGGEDKEGSGGKTWSFRFGFCSMKALYVIGLSNKAEENETVKNNDKVSLRMSDMVLLC